MKYRALEKVEFRDARGRSVIVAAGEEFDEPPKEANIQKLVRSKSVERVKA